MVAHRWRPVSGLGAVGTVLPAVFLVLDAALHFAYPDLHDAFSAPLTALVPVVAAATAGIVGAVAYTALAVVLSIVLLNVPGWTYQHGDFNVEMAVLGIAFGASVLLAHLRARSERKVARLQSVAETVQRAVLPPIPERSDSMQVAAEYLAAEEEARIGGDLYDIQDTPFGLRMIIGDVRGKGLSAVASANIVLGAFREVSQRAPSLERLAEQLDASVRRYQTRADVDTEEFITATLVAMPAWAEIEFLCCGHPGPLLIRGGGVTQLTASWPQAPLGLWDMSPVGSVADTTRFDVGDCLLLYTDGVIEARDPKGRFYPLEERVRARPDRDPAELVRYVVDDLLGHAGGRLGDDAALLAGQRKGQREVRAV